MIDQISDVGNIVFGFLAGMVLFRVIGELIDHQKPKSQKRLITSVAIFNGLILEIGFSPMETTAAELTPLTPLIPDGFPLVIATLVAVGTFFELLYGFGKMVDGSNIVGVAAFLVAFVAGGLLPYEETVVVGGVLLFVALFLSELSPATHWMTRSF